MVFIRRLRLLDLKCVYQQQCGVLGKCRDLQALSCRDYGSVRNNGKPVIGVLGAGISGLSAAYYINKMYGANAQVVMFEESQRVGGWMRTVKGKSGGFFEMGPRTIRPVGVRGLNTLDLVEEIGLDNEVLFVEKSHEVAKSRFIYVHKKLVKLPSDYKPLFKKVQPFSRPLFWAVLRDIFTTRKKTTDDSIHEFMTRRFGSEIANYLTDPLIRGVLAGDSKRISIRFLMKDIFEMEQKYGSVVVGMLRERFSKKECKVREEDKNVGFSKIGVASIMGNWAVWGLEGGAESLPKRIYEKIQGEVQVKFGCRVQRLGGGAGSRVTVEYECGGVSDTLECDHVVSSVGGDVLGRILQASDEVCREGVAQQLREIEYEDLQVSGVRFKRDVLGYRGFGFLVPSWEESVPGLLGVVFDSNCFPQGEDTVVTVMSRGVRGGKQSEREVVEYLKKCLGVQDEPYEVWSEVLKACIPQYGVGHYERVARVLEGVSGGALSICGNWVDGVSVNDCVFGGKRVAESVGEVVIREREKGYAAAAL